MKDQFPTRSGISSAREFFEITPSDDEDLPQYPKAVWVGTSGDLAVVGSPGSDPVTLTNVLVFNRAQIATRIAPNTTNVRINDGSNLSVAGAEDARGMHAANRTGPSRQYYRNGAPLGSDVQASLSLESGNFFYFWSGNTYAPASIAVGFFGGALTAGEHAAAHAAISDYLTTIGAV